MKSYSDRFFEDGFCVIQNAIPSELVEQANLAIEAFRKRNNYLLQEHDLLVDGLFQRVVNFHYSIKPLQDIFISAMKAGADVVDQFGKATLYTSLFFELGSQQPLHRDTPYFYSGNQGGYMGVWAALDDVDENNGALLAVKGSHKLPEANLTELKRRFYPSSEVPPSSTPLFNAYNDELVEMAKNAGLPVVTCTVKKGDLIIWNPATLHGGLPHVNKARTRRSFVMHITPENMPMHHMDYFFNREKKIMPVKRQYHTFKDRLFAAGDMIDFRHVKQFPVSELGTFF